MANRQRLSDHAADNDLPLSPGRFANKKWLPRKEAAIFKCDA